MAGLDVARNGLRAWAVTSGNEVIARPYETWKDGIDKSFTQDGTYDIYWAVNLPCWPAWGHCWPPPRSACPPMPRMGWPIRWRSSI
ncbi:hypothetical protein G6F68_018874 [Rhizopus microsporus]|nr:hypothetical protein G6F68_018874 [Rhizopus microsporus]